MALEQAELSSVRNHLAVEVWCLDVLVEGQLPHRGRRRQNIEREEVRGFPTGDGFDEAARGEHAMANGSDACAIDAGLDGVSDSGAENAGWGLGNLWEGHDGLPDLLNRCTNDHGRGDGAERFRWLGGAVKRDQAGEDQHEEQWKRWRQTATASRAESQAESGADRAEEHRQWESDEQANETVESEDQDEAAKAEQAKHRHPVSGRKRNLPPESGAEGRKKADDDRQTEKETPAVELENANAQRRQAETQQSGNEDGKPTAVDDSHGRKRVQWPNHPKLSAARGWRAGCKSGERRRPEAVAS